MLTLKRTVAYVLTIVMLFGIVCSGTSAVSAKTVSPVISFSVNIDTDSLITYLEEELVTCPKRVDVSAFGIPYTNEDGVALQNLVWHGTPLLFHVSGIGLSGANGIIEYLFFTYHYTATEYRRMLDECMAVADKMTADIKDNKAIDDVTKALLLHDRIIVNCEYDLKGATSGNISNESQEMYGALVNGVATCQGYAYAYMYLLELVGIESYVCTSEDMRHDWNIVILNGKKYHVDVTFDDPVQDVTGRVYHDYFLLSTQALKKSEHNYNDFDSSPNATTYDNYYWRNSRAEFVLVGSDIYYIDNINEYLYRLGNSNPILDISDIWTTYEGNYWKGNFSRLSTDGVNILYSKSDAVCMYTPSSGAKKTVYRPSFSGEATGIYGFTCDGGYMIIDRFDSPAFESDTKSKYQLRVPYDTQAPKAAASYTNNVSAYQTLTFSFSDNNGIAGYYWGREELYSANKLISTHSASVTEYVSQSGKYYLTAMDTAGNLSETVSVEFVLTRLETDGAGIVTASVITPKGESFTLPVPAKNGYEFIGWSETYTDMGNYIERYTPKSDGVLYALWRYTGESDPSVDQPVYKKSFEDVPGSAWYADAVAYCVGKGYINGVSDTRFSPAANLTREQFVVILANVAGIKTDNYKFVNSGMKDVAVGRWYSGAVAWGVSEGYVKGMSADRFGLGQNITREQLARLFYVYAEDIGIDVKGRASLTGFSDRASVSDWAYENVEWAVYSGIISGMTENALGPRGYATRAQAARMFMVFDKLQ
ncbi:MAG: S-layer homology domain-containing protein [Clostridia bacterium]|nr:S-layer homology domain-containing protein [Clostridia bacterium]